MGRKPPEVDTDAVLVEQIAQTQALLDDARDEGDRSNAVRAQTLLARLTGDLEHRRRAREIAKVRDPIRRVQMMRDMAEADGSWVAAASLQREVVKLQREKRAHDQAEAERNMAGMTEEQVLDELIAAASSLPAPLRARLRASITEH